MRERAGWGKAALDDMLQMVGDLGKASLEVVELVLLSTELVAELGFILRAERR